jgi:hypothetical protein
VYSTAGIQIQIFKYSISILISISNSISNSSIRAGAAGTVQHAPQTLLVRDFPVSHGDMTEAAGKAGAEWRLCQAACWTSQQCAMSKES